MSDEDNDEEREVPLGSALDALGITGTLDDGELVAGAIVLMKVLQEDGSTRLSMSYSEGLGWIERAGMLRIAEAMETGVMQPQAPGSEG
ncbi:hypothetical protein ACF09J_07720 [Streptomyces sp. NPDC014889]|uniref:hypothetical protein n=1 Tax=Streptomyces sp. NPDC014889 TaxID=3364928 RepID=UPI0036F549F8